MAKIGLINNLWVLVCDGRKMRRQIDIAEKL